jgi:hypothetical protein
MRRENKSFNPAFLIMALLAVTALGVIAGTLVYRTSTEKSANNTALETDEPGNRTIPAQYQFVVDKPESGEPKDSLSKGNLTSLPSGSASMKKGSGDKQDEESSESDAENERQTTQNEEPVKETEAPAASEEDEELPPPPPLRRDRKEDNKQDKDKQKNKNSKPETQEQEPPVEESEN